VSAALRTPDLRKALKLASETGFSIGAIEFPAEGGFTIRFGSPLLQPAPANEWDEALGDAHNPARPDAKGPARPR
jgi:hypothetical protein